jgi:hypothetical protein
VKPGKATPVKAAKPGEPIDARGRGHSGKPVKPTPDHPGTSSKPGAAAKPDHGRAEHPAVPPAQPQSKPKDSQPAPPAPAPAPADDCGPAGNGEGHAYGRCDAPGRSRASG